MNVPAATISAVFGVAFLWAGYTLYYQPSWIQADFALDAILTTNHSKARAAVSRLLFNPASAEFSTLRSVEEDAEKYVCGNVKAKDKVGHYAEYRAFVYTAAIDFARIDDDGRIAQKHDAFRACPVAEEEKDTLPTVAMSPGALSMVKTIQKVVPPMASSSLIAMGTKTSAGGASGAKMEQQIGELGSRSGSASQLVTAGQSGSEGQPGPAGQQTANSKFNAALGNENDWRTDRPPGAWPVFPSDHPLAKPAQKRTKAQAMALAADVEHRWEQSKSGSARARPSSEEIREACRALLAIDPKEAEFPKAWAAFVRLRKIDRDMAA